MKKLIYELHVLRYTVKYDIMKLKLRSLIYVFVCVKYLEEHGK